MHTDLTSFNPAQFPVTDLRVEMIQKNRSNEVAFLQYLTCIAAANLRENDTVKVRQNHMTREHHAQSIYACSLGVMGLRKCQRLTIVVVCWLESFSFIIARIDMQAHRIVYCNA